METADRFVCIWGSDIKGRCYPKPPFENPLAGRNEYNVRNHLRARGTAGFGSPAPCTWGLVKTWVYFRLFEVRIRTELLRNAAAERGAALRSATAVWFLSCNILLPRFSCVVASSPGSGLHCCSGAGQVDFWEQVELTNSVARSEDVDACLTSASPAMLPLLEASKTPGTAVCPIVEVIPYLYELL